MSQTVEANSKPGDIHRSSSGSNVKGNASSKVIQTARRTQSSSKIEKKGSSKKSGSMKSKSDAKYSSKPPRPANEKTASHPDSYDEVDVLRANQDGVFDEDDKTKAAPASIKGMWKKAIKSMKSDEKEKKDDKKHEKGLKRTGSFLRRKDSKEQEEQEELQQDSNNPVDPVYSLLKCAADLPRANRPCLTPLCIGHHGKSECGATPSPLLPPPQIPTPSSSSPDRPNHYHNEYHDMVDKSLGGDFKFFYKMTSPANKKSHMFDPLF